MKYKVFDTHEQMSEKTAMDIIKVIKKKPECLLCIAAGHTQIETLLYLTKYIKEHNIDCSKVSVIGLDEWVGFSSESDGSCISFIGENFLYPANIKPENHFFFDGKADDLASECESANAFIDTHGPIDVTVLGVGMNGHLGFNEPGALLTSRSHVRELDNTSKTVSSKYFSEEVVVTSGITLGLLDLFNSKKVIVQCTGSHKAPITKKFMEGEITNEVPASLVRNVKDAVVYLDRLSYPETEN